MTTQTQRDRRLRLAVAAIRTAQGHLEEAERLTWRLADRAEFSERRIALGREVMWLSGRLKRGGGRP